MQSKVQNLDGMTPEDLRKVKDPLLQPYAQLKLKVMEARVKGQIAKALLLEDKCEGLFRKLPDYLQW